MDTEPQMKEFFDTLSHDSGQSCRPTGAAEVRLRLMAEAFLLAKSSFVPGASLFADEKMLDHRGTITTAADLRKHLLGLEKDVRVKGLPSAEAQLV